MPFSVLHVSQPVDYGVGRCVAMLVEDQVRRGWEVTVAAPPDGELPAEIARIGAPLVPWPAMRSPGRGVVGEARRLAAAVRRIRPDVVHLHSSKAGLSGRLALRGSVPTLFQTHGWSFLAVD